MAKNHREAIEQIASELNLDRDKVEKILSMAFCGRGIIEKMKYPNVIVIPGIGSLSPQPRTKEITDGLARLKKTKEVWNKRKQTARKKEELKNQPKPINYYEEYFFDKEYLEKLIANQFNQYYYHTWQMKPHQNHH